MCRKDFHCKVHWDCAVSVVISFQNPEILNCETLANSISVARRIMFFFFEFRCRITLQFRYTPLAHCCRITPRRPDFPCKVKGVQWGSADSWARRRPRVGSIPVSSIFRKRFENSWGIIFATLYATRCMIPSTTPKKFRSHHHASRRIKNQILGAFRYYVVILLSY